MSTNLKDDLLQQLLSRNVDFKGRRVVNAGNARSLQDYITKYDLRNPEIISILTPNGTLLFTFTDTSIIAALDIEVPDEVYGSGWDGNLEIPTKNAIYDKIQTLIPIEGTFTPQVTFGGGNTGITYSIQYGIYQKIGSWVSINAIVTLANKGSSTGNIALTNLPFLLENVVNHYVTCAISLNSVTGLTGDFIESNMAPNTSEILLYELIAGSAIPLTEANVTNNSQFQYSIRYKVG